MELDEFYGDIADLIDVADEREIPLSQVQNIFRNISNVSARNFFGLKKRLNEFYDVKLLNNLKNDLEELVRSHMKFDDKMITLIRNINLIDLESKLQQAFDTDFEPERYAYSAYKVEQLSEHKKLYQFSTVREINVRESLSVSSLKEEIVEDYQELIGVKKMKLHCYDFVLLDFERDDEITLL